ncbi:MAG: hypothetical protein MUO19_06780 [Dehalococcoidales bacterium]|nr:hypothetical protein [Dehalococcoidales bacterium]
MKVAISFVSGIIVCTLMLVGVRTVLPIRAETTSTDNITDNVTQTFLNLLPDIEKIYREALQMPFQKAESKIYDEDIAEFYRDLMDATGLAPEEPEQP